MTSPRVRLVRPVPNAPCVPDDPRVRVDRREGDGPTLVITGAIHGNEPAGLIAAERFVRALPRLRGRVLVVEGNRGARALGRRFVVRDLNRLWSEASVAQKLDDPDAEHEDREQAELARLFAKLETEHGGPLVFVDLHTTSGDSPAFVCAADTLANRELARSVPLPLVLGLEETIEGTMLGWLVGRGHVGIAIEGGRHDDPAAIGAHEAALVCVLHRLGMAEFDAVRRREAHQTLARDVPSVVEIRHRHVVREGDGFVMRPGFTSFDPVARGQTLAEDHEGPIVADEDALVLMPRYQAQGDDGFFLARPVRPFWLGVSSAARTMKVDRVLRFLPGIARDDEGALVTTTRQPPPGVVGVMHLCGFRRVRPHGEGLRFERRREAERWPGR
ncbi:MAG: succinylglutamate desuccinylase/aspartoacylase family protein [Sandaracinus sp.]|nr:succinylglutamate desuccinylase/aspartoacylase family protein [Sandaracinus sp.]MCB9618118.1 succinylglutamate desuccinylase/aspartoacylase family protein [Sandaracinus sp.]